MREVPNSIRLVSPAQCGRDCSASHSPHLFPPRKGEEMKKIGETVHTFMRGTNKNTPPPSTGGGEGRVILFALGSPPPWPSPPRGGDNASNCGQMCESWLIRDQGMFLTIFGPSHFATGAGRRFHVSMKSRYFGLVGLKFGISLPGPRMYW